MVARGVDVRVDVLVGVCCVAWYCDGGGGGVAVGLAWVLLGWFGLGCGECGYVAGRVVCCVVVAGRGGTRWAVACGGAWMVVTPWGRCVDRCRE